MERRLGELRTLVMSVRRLLLNHHLEHEAGGGDPVDLSGYVTKSTFDANTVLKADTDNTPEALAVAASRILGRAAAGGITALTAAEVSTLLSLTNYVTKALFDANTILAANADNTPVALPVAASRFLGRKAAGNIAAMTGAEALALLDLTAYVTKALFDANTILAANADNTPLALTIAASRILGRGAAGNIAALTGAQIMAILTGQAGADFSMNTHKITSVVDPGANQDAATKKYVDDNVSAAGSVLARAFLDTPELNFPHGKNVAVGLNDTSFDADSMFQTGVWQQGVADAGSNATTIVDADPTTGAGFEAAMRYYRVTWDGGASYGFIESVDSPTQVTIYKTTGANMAPGDTYTITKAYFLIPTAGYWLLSGTANWIWNTVVADKEYLTEFLVNGVFTGRIVAQTAALKGLNPISVDMVHLAVDDKVALACESYAGVDTSDIYGSAAAAHTWMNIVLLKAD